jgi:hypothetical protein
MLYSLSHYLYFPGHVHLHPFCNPPYHRTYAPHLCKWGTCITKSDCLIQSLPKKTCMIQEQLFWSTVCLKNLYEWNRVIVLGVGLDNPYQVLRFHSFESWLWLCNLCKSFPSKTVGAYNNPHHPTPSTTCANFAWINQVWQNTKLLPKTGGLQPLRIFCHQASQWTKLLLRPPRQVP